MRAEIPAPPLAEIDACGGGVGGHMAQATRAEGDRPPAGRARSGIEAYLRVADVSSGVYTLWLSDCFYRKPIMVHGCRGVTIVVLPQHSGKI